MNRLQRKALSLVMSLVLTVFSLCQVQAWASDGAAMQPAQSLSERSDMSDCHRAELDAATPMPDCCSVCEQLGQHPDVGVKLTHLDHSPVILAIAEAYGVEPPAATAHMRYRPPDPFVVNPPPTTRYQRLLN